MTRSKRIEYKGGIYHLTSRGNNKEYIFKESDDKEYFLNLLKECSFTMGYIIYGYVIMDNHYHIVMQTFDKDVHVVMHHINCTFSRFFNKKYERVGHVFQRRYDARRILEERYLLTVLRYIHQNPIRAGISILVEGYRWSSDFCYRVQDNSFVSIDILLNLIDKDRLFALQKYKELMVSEDRVDFDKVYATNEDTAQIFQTDDNYEIQKLSLNDILFETGASWNDIKLIKSGSRKRTLTEYKIKYVLKALEQHYPLSEIGRNIGVSAASIEDLLKRYSNKIETLINVKN